MAAGEYVSVSSQADIEKSDLHSEKMELEAFPQAELEELTAIYEQRGLKNALAVRSPNSFTAALASALSFIIGGLLPLLTALFAPV